MRTGKGTELEVAEAWLNCVSITAKHSCVLRTFQSMFGTELIYMLTFLKISEWYYDLDGQSSAGCIKLKIVFIILPFMYMNVSS